MQKLLNYFAKLGIFQKRKFQKLTSKTQVRFVNEAPDLLYFKIQTKQWFGRGIIGLTVTQGVLLIIYKTEKGDMLRHFARL